MLDPEKCYKKLNLIGKKSKRCSDKNLTFLFNRKNIILKDD